MAFDGEVATRRREGKVLPHSSVCTQCHSKLQTSLCWHPIIPVPLCLGCYVSTINTIRAFYRRHQEEARSNKRKRKDHNAVHNEMKSYDYVDDYSNRHNIDQSEDTHGPDDFAPFDSVNQAPITVCIWCLRLAQGADEAWHILRCKSRSTLPYTELKHPSDVVFCKACLERYFDKAVVDKWCLESEEGGWTCLICNKVPFLELAWEEGWGLPQYPQDLRLSVEIQDLLIKIFAEPHPRRSTPAILYPDLERQETSEGLRPATTAANGSELNSVLSPNSSSSLRLQSYVSDQQGEHLSDERREVPLAPEQERELVSSPLEFLCSLSGCESNDTLLVLIEHTQQALSLLRRLWQEAAVQVAAREDMLDMGTELVEQIQYVRKGSQKEGKIKCRTPIVENRTINGVKGSMRPAVRELEQEEARGNRGCNDKCRHTGSAIYTRGANQAEREAQEAVRTSLTELRVLLRHMQYLRDQHMPGVCDDATINSGTLELPQKRSCTGLNKASGDVEKSCTLYTNVSPSQHPSHSDSSSAGLDYEMERLKNLQGWLVSSQGLLRSLHTQVLHVLARAHLPPPEASKKVYPPAEEEPQQLSQLEEANVQVIEREQKEGDVFQRRLKASEASLRELGKDLSVRLEDVGYAVSILCQMKEGLGDKGVGADAH